MDIEKDIIDRFIAEAILKALTEPTDNPTDIEQTTTHTEKPSMAWIEVYDDELDKAYDMSKEYREYGKL